jgi:His-Xaa-Ser system protein HxsD
VQAANPIRSDQVALDTNRAAITLDRDVYPLDAVYGAAYVFIDRCYVLFDAPDDKHIRVELAGRQPLSAEALGELAGEFGNELVTQLWRSRVLEHNRPLVQALASRALSGAAGLEGLEGLDEMPGELSADAFDDPLGIAIPWEEKYGGKLEASVATPPEAAAQEGTKPAE